MYNKKNSIEKKRKNKDLYVSELWADTTNDVASIETRLNNLEQQVFKLEKIIKQIK